MQRQEILKHQTHLCKMIIGFFFPGKKISQFFLFFLFLHNILGSFKKLAWFYPLWKTNYSILTKLKSLVYAQLSCQVGIESDEMARANGKPLKDVIKDKPVNQKRKEEKQHSEWDLEKVALNDLSL